MPRRLLILAQNAVMSPHIPIILPRLQSRANQCKLLQLSPLPRMCDSVESTTDGYVAIVTSPFTCSHHLLATNFLPLLDPPPPACSAEDGIAFVIYLGLVLHHYHLFQLPVTHNLSSSLEPPASFLSQVTSALPSLRRYRRYRHHQQQQQQLCLSWAASSSPNFCYNLQTFNGIQSISHSTTILTPRPSLSPKPPMLCHFFARKCPNRMRLPVVPATFKRPLSPPPPPLLLVQLQTLSSTNRKYVPCVTSLLIFTPKAEDPPSLPQPAACSF